MEIRNEAINRLLRIIEKSSRKLQIAICFPIILKNEKFRNLFPDKLEEIDHIYNLCDNINFNHEYSNTEKCSSIDEVSKIVKKSDDEYSRVKSKLNVILTHISKYEDEIISIINDNLDKFSDNLKNIIEQIRSSKQILEWQMRMTPKQFREYKTKLRNAKVLIRTSQEEINKLQTDFNDQTSKHNEVVNELQNKIINLNLIIDQIKRARNEELDRKMNSYKTRLRGLRADIDEKEYNLHNQLVAHEMMLKKLVQLNIEQEKLLRKDCEKAEKKYLKVLRAYDNDLGKLDELKQALELQLNATNNHYDALKAEYDVQDILFAKLKKERELAIMQAFAKQMENFEKNRAARIIQRTWRAYHQRLLSKKKKRTRKKK